MKLLVLLPFLLLSLSSCKYDNVEQEDVALSNYIELRYGGVQDKFIAPLIISTQKVHFNVARSDVLTFDPKEPLTPEMKESYLNMHYSFITIDSTTYQLLVHFFNENPVFFTVENHGRYVNYSTTEKGNTYEVLRQLKPLFVLNLNRYLQMNKGDEALIEELARY